MRAIEAFDLGMPKKAIARELGVSRAAVRSWVIADLETLRAARTRLACQGGTDCHLVSGAPRKEYAYLVGQYLGDGCLSEMKPGLFRLRITACTAYPGIESEIRAAIAAVLPFNSVGSVDLEGCREIYAYSKHAICLFPQHGAGAKHKRFHRALAMAERHRRGTHSSVP